MKNIWRNDNISLKVKTRSYEAIILSTLLYGADVWPLTATLTTRLDAPITSQMAKEHTEHLVERLDNKRGGQNQNWTTNHGQHTERKTTSMTWACFPYGPPAYTTASTILAGTRIQERTRSTTSELEEHSQPRPTKDGLSWEEAEMAALDRHGWRRSVAQCVQLDAG